MNDIGYTIQRYLEPALGESKTHYQQLRFDCPRCDSGHKKNLEVCINERSKKHLLFSCWSCHYSGFIRKLLEDYAVDTSWKTLPEFKPSNRKSVSSKKIDSKILFPKDTVPYYVNERVERYLVEERGIPHMELHKRNVRYCHNPDDKYYNHILFPFYDHEDALIGFCAQNFTTKKYKNIGTLTFVPYEQFIQPLFPIVITEGIYDALSVPNAIPLLGTNINNAVYKFCKDKKVILALDNDKEIGVEIKKKYIKKLYVYGAAMAVIFELGVYKDLNDFYTKNQPELKTQMKVMFELLMYV